MINNPSKIKYISSFAINDTHSIVNSSFLQMICNIFEGVPIKIIASPSTFPTLKQASKRHPNTKFKKIYINRKHNRLGFLLRYLQSAISNIWELLISRKNEFLFYNFNNVFSLEIVNLLAKTFFKNRRITILCHGELEYLINAEKHNALYKKVLSYLTKSFFLSDNPGKISSNIKFIVLGDIILDNLSSVINKNFSNKFYSIDHPLFEMKVEPSGINHESEDIKEMKPGKLNVGTVGILNKYKGSENYLELLKRRNYKDIKFYIVGQIQHDLDNFKDLGVITANNPDIPLSPQEYKSLLSELDYILLLYPQDTYKLIASGALLDTLRFKKPVLALRNDYFQYFFEKYGEVGKLFDSIEELSNFLYNLQENRELQENKFQYDSIIKNLSPDSLTPQLKKFFQNNSLSDNR